MPEAVVLSIGSELLTGAIINTNAAYLCRKLHTLGFSVNEVRAVPDEPNILKETLVTLTHSANIIITTGGLGPTFDDLTPGAIAKAAQRDLAFNEHVYDHIVGTLQSKGVSILESHKSQAYLPVDCHLFPNDRGTAFGFAVPMAKSICIALPGVPYEMEYMFQHYVLPWLKEQFTLTATFGHTIRLIGLPESDVDAKLQKMNIPGDIDVIINTSKGQILIRLQSKNEEQLKLWTHEIRERFGQHFMGLDDQSVAAVLLLMLEKTNETLCTAESCTGGWISKVLTDVPGSSKVFKGGAIVYSNELKIQMLNVAEKLIEEHGAVSEETARAMVRGAKQRFQTDAAIAVTGIAGPTGGSEEKPVGTVCLGLAYGDAEFVTTVNLPGDRMAVRHRATNLAIYNLVKLIRKNNTHEN